MTVLSGRGARQAARTLLGGVFVVLALITGGCGSDTFTYGTPVITFSTTPGPFTSYLVQMVQIYMTRDDGTNVYPLNTSNVPEFVDLVKFTDRTEIYGSPGMLEGKYLSATITISYAAAQIFANIGGVSKALTALDANTTSTTPTTATLGQLSYKVTFDPANPLIIKRGVSTPIDFNFDLSASSVIDAANLRVYARPYLTASTQPVYNKPLRTRGVFVIADPTNSNFTLNSRAFFDTYSQLVGAIEVDTDSNTTYSVNGTSYRGAAGLQALQALGVNSQIEAYGVLGSLNVNKPIVKATQVYAGSSSDNLSGARITGTVTARSGNSLKLRGAQVTSPYTPTNLGLGIALAVNFYDSATVTVNNQTVVAVDGQPEISSPSTQLISVGQRVLLDGTAQFTTDSSGNQVFTGVDASGGFARLQPTTAWGTVTPTPQTSSAQANLLTLGGYPPAAMDFTGTGSNAGTYRISGTSSVDLSTLPATPTSLVRFDGLVSPFGGAPPDFTASAAAKATDSPDQLTLVVDWGTVGTAGTGSLNPFVSVASDGLTVNMSDPNLSTSHYIQAGPSYIQSTLTTTDLTNPLVNPKIVPASSGGLTFVIGNSSSTGFAVFHSYSAFQTALSTALNNTNKIQKLVAVGQWDGATFTANRIDIVQLP